MDLTVWMPGGSAALLHSDLLPLDLGLCGFFVGAFFANFAFLINKDWPPAGAGA